MNHVPKIFCLLVCMLSMVVPGCRFVESRRPHVDTTPAFSVYHRPDVAPMKRLVLLPLDASANADHHARNLQQRLAQAMSLCLNQEVLALTPEDIGPCLDRVVIDGRYDEFELVQISNRFQADGILFGRVDVRRAYHPQAIDVVCHLVDAREAIVASTVKGSWDLSLKNDSIRFGQFYEQHCQEFDDPDIALASPDWFAVFVARELAQEFKR